MEDWEYDIPIPDEDLVAIQSQSLLLQNGDLVLYTPYTLQAIEVLRGIREDLATRSRVRARVRIPRYATEQLSTLELLSTKQVASPSPTTTNDEESENSTIEGQETTAQVSQEQGIACQNQSNVSKGNGDQPSRGIETQLDRSEAESTTFEALDGIEVATQDLRSSKDIVDVGQQPSHLETNQSTVTIREPFHLEMSEAFQLDAPGHHRSHKTLEEELDAALSPASPRSIQDAEDDDIVDESSLADGRKQQDESDFEEEDVLEDESNLEYEDILDEINHEDKDNFGEAGNEDEGNLEDKNNLEYEDRPDEINHEAEFRSFSIHRHARKLSVDSTDSTKSFNQIPWAHHDCSLSRQRNSPTHVELPYNFDSITSPKEVAATSQSLCDMLQLIPGRSELYLPGLGNIPRSYTIQHQGTVSIRRRSIAPVIVSRAEKRHFAAAVSQELLYGGKVVPWI